MSASNQTIFILGVDQGSTHTRAAVCNEQGLILGLGVSYGACHSVHGMTTAMEAVSEAAGQALQATGIDSTQVNLLYAGMTGADWPDEYSLLHDNLLGLGLAQDVYVVNDSLVALRGGTRAPYGAIVVAGTGTNCAILAPDGREFIYHYYVDDDLQGGMGLGRRMLRAIYRAETGREENTRLKELVLEALGFSSVDDLLRAQSERRLPHDQIKSLAPLVFQASCEEDAVAIRIIESFGDGLSELVVAGLERFDMTGLPVEVVVSGSIFKGPGKRLHRTMEAVIRRVAPFAHLVDARYEPVVGALFLALESLPKQPPGRRGLGAAVLENIEDSSRKLGLVRRREG